MLSFTKIESKFSRSVFLHIFVCACGHVSVCLSEKPTRLVLVVMPENYDELFFRFDWFPLV